MSGDYLAELLAAVRLLRDRARGDLALAAMLEDTANREAAYLGRCTLDGDGAEPPEDDDALSGALTVARALLGTTVGQPLQLAAAAGHPGRRS